MASIGADTHSCYFHWLINFEISHSDFVLLAHKGIKKSTKQTPTFHTLGVIIAIVNYRAYWRQMFKCCLCTKISEIADSKVQCSLNILFQRLSHTHTTHSHVDSIGTSNEWFIDCHTSFGDTFFRFYRTISTRWTANSDIYCLKTRTHFILHKHIWLKIWHTFQMWLKSHRTKLSLTHRNCLSQQI